MIVDVKGDGSMKLFDKLKNLTKAEIIMIIFLILGILVSVFVLEPAFTNVDMHAGSIIYLDQKSSDIITLSASTTAASAAISLIPTDAGAPIAEKLMDFNLYFLIILCGIFIEKYLLTISGYIVFNFLIPIASVCGIGYILLKSQRAKMIGGKLCAFSVVLILVVPTSVQLSKLIDQTHQISLQQNIEDSDSLTEESEGIENEDGEGNWLDNLGNMIGDGISSLTSGVSDLVNKGEALLSDLLETVAVMIITSCFIPILVFLILYWATKLILGVEIPLPQKRLKLNKKEEKENEVVNEYIEA